MANLGKSVKGKNKKKKMAPAGDAVAGKVKRLEDAELAMRLAALERRRLRDALEKEKKMTKFNLPKITETWRKIMRLAKVETLRKDIEILSQNHERDVDRKDAIIQMLDRDVEEAEEQYQIALRQHLRRIDRLVDLQDERLLSLEEEFDHGLAAVEHEFSEEKTTIAKAFSVEKHQLMTLIETVATEESEKRTEAKTEFDQTKEILRNRNLESIHNLQSQLDAQIEDLERAFESAHLNYLTSTDSRTQEFKDLTAADSSLSSDIDIKIRKIEKLQNSLQHWRAKMAANSKECEERNATLKAEQQAITSHFQRLKAQVARQREAQAKRLVSLSKEARATCDGLKERADQAERILVLAERSRVLETDKEKVMFECKEEPAEDLPSSVVPDTLKEGAGAGATYSELDNFYTKYNKVLLDKLTLERERDSLATRNAELQSVLRQYLEGVSIADGAVTKPNTLLMVNGETSIAVVPVRHAREGIPVVDGNHMVATGRARGGR